jgi:DUF1009 family protein
MPPENSRPIDNAPPRRIGLMAAWGRFPLLVAQAMQAQGYDVYCLGISGEADPALADVCREFRWIGLAKMGAAIREAMMAGKIHKVSLFRPWSWLRLLPDLRMIRACVPHFVTRRKDCRDDSLLGMLVSEFAADGIRLAPPTDYAPHLLVRRGCLSRRRPSAWQWKDIEFGWRIAKEMGRLDIGQSVAVKDQAVLAVEAIEGTDQCIRRAGTLCTGGGFTVVKVAKPQQDMRFDVPTVGVGTLRSMVDSGAKVLAIEADRTILLDRPELIALADRHKLAIVVIADGSDRTEPPDAHEPDAADDASGP